MKKYYLFLLVAPLLLVVGCNGDAKQQLAEKDRQITQLSGERDSLRAELDQTQAKLGRLERDVAEKAQEVSKQDRLIAELKGSINNRLVTVKKSGKRTRIRLPSSLVFRSGEAALAASGIKVLRSFAPVLGKHKGYYLEVSGFTDNTPIGPKLQKRYKNNLELSQERAVRVVNFLRDTEGLPHRMAATGFGEQFPAVSNRTKGSRQENRRVIVTLVPLAQRPR